MRQWVQYLTTYNKWYRHVRLNDIALALLGTHQGERIQRLFEIDDDDVADVKALVDGPVNDGSNITDDDEDISHTGVFRSTVNVDERS